jgi:hypothetical protein
MKINDKPGYFPFDPETSGFPVNEERTTTHISGAYTYCVLEEGMLSPLGHSIPVRHEGRIMLAPDGVKFYGGHR